MIEYANLLSAGFPVYRALIQLGVFPPRCVDGIDVDHWHLLVQHLVKDRGQMEMKLDPVGSTVRYEMMKLCTGSV